MNKAVLYTRVSSKEQENEGYSLDAQVKQGQEYARRNKLELVKLWKVSESAWSAGRTEFNQMVEFAKRRADVQHLIFDCLDRMTRNDFDKVKIWSLIKDFDKTIHFARTGKAIDKFSGSDEEFMFDIEVAVAKKMSNDISKRASMGMREKAEQGKYPGRPPIGYTTDPVTKQIIPDDNRSLLVTMSFELMASGQYSLQSLVSKMTDLGFLSVNGYKFYKSTMAHILNNPFYFGAFSWKGSLYSGNHQALVSKSIWDDANAVLSGKGHPAKPRLNGFTFNNLAECGLCGCRVIGEKKKNRYVYYHCTFSRGRHKDVRNINDSIFIELFDSTVQNATISDDCRGWMEDLLEVYQRKSGQSTEQLHNLLMGRKDTLVKRLDRLFDTYCDGVIDRDAFQRKERAYRSELTEAESRLKDLEVDQAGGTHNGVKILELANQLYPTYLGMDAVKKAQLLRLLASNYTLTGTSVSATYRTPFKYFANLPHRPIKYPRQDSNLLPSA